MRLALLDELHQALRREVKRNPLRYIEHKKRGVIPLRLFAKQAEFVNLYRRVRRVAGWDGPNRPGKTTVAAMLAVELLCGLPLESWPHLTTLPDRPPGPKRSIGCITISREKSRDVQQKAIADRIPQAWLKCKPWTERTGFGDGKPCVLSNGSQVDFLSDLQREQTLEGFQWDLAWIDEAVERHVYDRVIARLTDTGGKLMITCVAESPWIYQVLRMRLMRPETLTPVSSDLVDTISDSTMFDNELIDEVDVASSIDLWGGESSSDTQMRVWGKYVHMKGAVLPQYDDVLHVEATAVVPRDEAGRPKWTIYELYDPGWKNPFGVLFCAVDEQNRRHFFDEIYARETLPAEIAREVLRIRARHGYAEPYDAVIDTAGTSARYWGVDLVSVQRQLAEHGVQTRPAEKGRGSIDSGLQKLRSLLAADRVRVQAHLRWLRFELLNYRYDEPAAGGEFRGDREKIIDEHNHLIDPWRYGEEKGLTHVPLEALPPPRGSAAWDIQQEQARRAAERQRVFK